MTPRHITQGRDSWNARTGYQHTMRVPGPSIPLEYPRPSIWERLKGIVR